MYSALLWLKINNPYYHDVVIDNEVLESLPENGSIFNKLPQIQEDQPEDDDTNDIEIDDEEVTRTFVPPTQREEEAINETLE